MQQAKKNIYNFSCGQLQKHLQELGHSSYRAKQIIKWLHQEYKQSFEEMTNLSKSFREQLQQLFFIPNITSSHESISKDGTIKWLFRVDSNNQVETVYIPENNRGTLCISSQAGCALACSFCATGMQGFSRNLTTAEIISQLTFANMRLNSLYQEKKKNVTNVVMMGMGEPLLNLKQLLPALNLMLDDNAYGLSKYRVTVSTSGIVPAMEILKKNSEASLAISLHAPNNTLRNELVPINKKYNIQMLINACRTYFSNQPKRKITIEYIMIENVNDSTTEAKQLVKLLSDINCKINLIPYNPISGSKYVKSPHKNCTTFRNILEKHGFQTTIRKTRGDDIDAACGQLAGDIIARDKIIQQETT